MNIQWYPGHMTKAVRMMQEDIKLIDIVYSPYSTYILKIIKNNLFYRFISFLMKLLVFLYTFIGNLRKVPTPFKTII